MITSRFGPPPDTSCRAAELSSALSTMCCCTIPAWNSWSDGIVARPTCLRSRYRPRHLPGGDGARGDGAGSCALSPCPPTLIETIAFRRRPIQTTMRPGSGFWRWPGSRRTGWHPRRRRLVCGGPQRCRVRLRCSRSSRRWTRSRWNPPSGSTPLPLRTAVLPGRAAQCIRGFSHRPRGGSRPVVAARSRLLLQFETAAAGAGDPNVRDALLHAAAAPHRRGSRFRSDGSAFIPPVRMEAIERDAATSASFGIIATATARSSKLAGRLLPRHSASTTLTGCSPPRRS